MAEKALLFNSGELNEFTGIEIKQFFGGRYLFEFTCTGCKQNIITPKMLVRKGLLICPNCKKEI